jgi:hypothetical protein
MAFDVARMVEAKLEQRMDPNFRMHSELGGLVVNDLRDELLEGSLERIERIGEKLKQAKAGGADNETIVAIEAVLKRVKENAVR